MVTAENQSELNHGIMLLLVGSRSVGRTQIMNRFSNDKFDEDQRIINTAAIGLFELSRKNKNININNKRVGIQLVRKEIQTQYLPFSSVFNRSIYQNADGIVLIYDCTEEQTFNDITEWHVEVQTYASSEVPSVLVANKSDLPNRVISTERGQSLAQEYGLKFYETSAKIGTNVDEIFYELAEQIVRNRLSQMQVNNRVKW